MSKASDLSSFNTDGASFKNRLINGAMVIDQRNSGASVTPTADGAFTVDRWKLAIAQASKFSFQQNAGSVTPPAGYIKYLGATSLSAYTVLTADYFAIYQSIEGLNAYDLSWGTASASTVTLSFWVRSSLTGTFSGSLYNGGGSTQSYVFTYTITSANTWENKTITVPGPTTGTWNVNNSEFVQVRFGLGTGATYVTATTGSWLTGNYVQSSGSTSVVGTNGATFYMTGVQFEKGASATSFDYRPITTELQLCQRYYYRTLATSGTSISAGGYAYSGTNAAQAYFALPVTMRAAPTSSYGGNLALQQLAGNWLVTAIAATQSSTTVGSLSFQIGSSSMTTGQYAMVYSSSATAYVDFYSEL